MNIYLAGYTGRKPDVLRQRAIELDAKVIDIRYSPNSRVEHWRREALASLLADRYVWCHALGNRNYLGGPIELVDADAGREFVHRLADRQNVILLCACAEREFCHRDTVGRLLERDGYEVRDLSWDGQETLV